MVVSPEVYTCWFPGCPIRISIQIPLIDAFRAAVSESSGDQQGLLYGQASDSETEVRASRPIKNLNAEELRAAMAGSSDSVVGYYRIRTGNSLVLTPEEIHLAETLFTKSGSVILLIERRDTDPEANCFFSENGAILNFPLLKFPLDSVSLVHRETQRRARAAAKAEDLQVFPATAEINSVAAAAEEGMAPRRRKRGLIFAAGFCVLVAAVSAGLYLNRNRIAAPLPVSSPPQAANFLRAERQGEDLKILWDLGSSAVATATSGVFDIQDGLTKRQIVMTADQVRFGSLLYSPVSDQVSVRLTTLHDNQPTTQASVLVLLNKSGEPASSGTPSVVSPPVPASGAAAPPVARVPAAANPGASPQPAQPLEPKAESRQATRTFVPPPGKKSAGPQLDAENSPPLHAVEHEIPVIQLPFAPVAPPPATAPTGPSKPQETPRQPSSPSSAPAVTPPARTEPAQTTREDVVAPVLIAQSGVRPPAELPPILRPIAIRVRVDVNPAGKVTHAQAIPENGVHGLLLQAAVDAAWKCTFRPARRQGAPISSSVTIVFHVDPPK